MVDSGHQASEGKRTALGRVAKQSDIRERRVETVAGVIHLAIGFILAVLSLYLLPLCLQLLRQNFSPHPDGDHWDLTQKEGMARPSIEPTDRELRDLSAAAQKLWDIDVNRCQPGRDYELDLQGGKRVHERGDEARHPLFRYVRDEALRRPTYAKFIALLDNYQKAAGTAEYVTMEEKKETSDFLDAILQTPCLQYTYRYLVARRAFQGSMADFKQELHKKWFHLYRREVQDDSSGFEHVFVGEERDGKVIGFHNWIQMYFEEKKGRFDYRGFILPRRSHGGRQPEATDHVLSLQFEWERDLKPVSTSFIGVSPEFEVALYTLFFFLGETDNAVQIHDYYLNIKIFRIGREMSRAKIGSCFPEQL